jgi:type VI secretion system secreted protein VgrG
LHVRRARRRRAVYPELRTPKPKVSGVESATVVGPAGEEIHTDEFGRVRVHFHWDRESQMDDNSSCWIHVSQPWGGTGFGGSNLPRVGQEVIVDFLGGDPDRPVVVGRVYTNLQKTPYKLPDNKTQSGWKSNSSPARAATTSSCSRTRRAGKELVRMQAEKDLEQAREERREVKIGIDLN